MVKVKICGLTSLEDALHALKSGADYLGFILYPKSPRFVPPQRRREILRKLGDAIKVAVMVNPTEEEVLRAFEEGFDLVQLHGEESLELARNVGPKRIIKAFRVRDRVPQIEEGWKDAFGVLLDTYSEKSYGGTGKSFDWEVAVKVREGGFKLFLSGGLRPENVRRAVEEVRPFAVDVSSGVEIRPGIKDKIKVERFIKEAKGL